MKRTNKHLFVTLLGTMAVVLAGCSMKTPLTQNKLTSEFEKNTTSVLNVYKYEEAKAQFKDKKSKNFIKGYDKNIEKEKKKVKKSVTEELQGADQYSGYSKDVYQYSKAVLDYISTAKGDMAIKKNKARQDKKYDKVAKAAVKVGTSTTSKQAKKYVSSVVGNDVQLQAKAQLAQGKKRKQQYKDKKKNKRSAYDDNDPYVKRQGQQNLKKKESTIININWGWGIGLLAVSGLLITTVFLQPNKSEDNSDALLDESKRPKPRGYELLMLRSTGVLIAVLVLMLIIMGRV